MTKKNQDDIQKSPSSIEVLDTEDLLSESDRKTLADIEISLTSPTSESREYLPVITPGSDIVRYDSKVGDPLSAYLKEIAKYDLLTIEEEQELTKRLVETGDIEVAKKLVAANLRLVVKIAMEYRSSFQNVMDLIQEGNIGLMKAVSKYDPDKGAKLSYYASWWIKSYILKYILDNFRLVKIGTTNEQKKLFYNLLKEKDKLAKQGIEPGHKLLSENLGVSEKAVALMDQRLSSSGSELSLDTPLGHDSSSGVLSDLLEDEGEGDISEKIADAQGLELLQDNLKDFVSGLKERDRDIFKKRLLSEVPPSLQNIADEYGVSRERIRQIEERLLKNLKVYMSEFIR
ncbi:RNA polymerase factor sigma-32 [Halobacteriovorax sp. JY17]|uniref:RNA polymerase factor sigma-32 n=1 Tax=Halobacteriovorax sp. JY17 TaxID=2014617 RepID=UPI000C3C86B0|nr:RNA polymerase factor sigma-32 [Halobacteriovorax sp. JY17]PIK15512.1 MAG: RNA polymerase subunit sigma-70 [Halobacteriovorax sp. JY17]